MHSEDARKWVHIGSGLFALLLRVLTPWQASGLAAFALVFNTVALPRIGGQRLYRPIDEARGFPLGIFEDVTYDEWGVTLEAGDIMVFHSDGIAETANNEGQLFGTERLRKLIEQHHQITAAELADRVLSEVDWFSQSAPLSDDRTLVVMKVK